MSYSVEYEESFITSGPGLEFIKLFMLNSTEHKISTAH